MVALKKYKFGLLAVVVVASVLFAIWMYGKSANDSERNNNSTLMCSDDWQAEFTAYVLENRRTFCPESEPSAVKEASNVVMRLAVAYRLAQSDAIQKIGCPQIIKHVSELSRKDFRKFKKEIIEIFWNDLRNPLRMSSTTTRDLAARIETLGACVSFLGDVLVARDDRQDLLYDIEPLMLEFLLTMRQHYKTKKDDDAVAEVEAMIVKWVGQIDSEKGYTRSWMRRKVEDLRWLENHGVEDRKERPKKIRQMLSRLLELGHTPKWVDEEFPPL